MQKLSNETGAGLKLSYTFTCFLHFCGHASPNENNSSYDRYKRMPNMDSSCQPSITSLSGNKYPLCLKEIAFLRAFKSNRTPFDAAWDPNENLIVLDH